MTPEQFEELEKKIAANVRFKQVSKRTDYVIVGNKPASNTITTRKSTNKLSTKLSTKSQQ